MKVLIDALTAREGGGVTYLRQILPCLREAAPAHEFHVALSSDYQSDMAAEMTDIVRVVPIRVSSGNMIHRLHVLLAEIPRLLVDGRYDVLFTVNEAGCPRPTRPHVMLARNYSTFAPLALYPTASARAAIAFYRLTREPLARIALRRATHVACVSETYRRVLIERVGLEESRTSVVHHGIDPIFTRVGEGRARAASIADAHLLCVSSLAPHKNYETLVRAYATALESTPLPPLLIVGAGTESPYGRALRALVKSLGVGDKVRFVGRVPHHDLPPLYRDAMLFVFPSRLETFGQPLLEAMSTGTPIIASESSVAREVCGEAALYFDARSAGELAERLTSAVKDPAVRGRLSALGYDRAGSFSWTRTAEQTVDRLERAAAER